MSLDPNAVVCFQDEVHFMAESTITRSWYKKGSRPKVKSYPGRKSVAYSGFVTPSDGKLYVSKLTWFNYETTIESIRAFLRDYAVPDGKRLYLIVDNAPWHKKARRLILDENNKEYADIRNSLTIIPLPPYSPDLNPIEQVWRITRREKTHNHFWPSLDLLTSTLDHWFAQFAFPNSMLASLCSFF